MYVYIKFYAVENNIKKVEFLVGNNINIPTRQHNV